MPVKPQRHSPAKLVPGMPFLLNTGLQLLRLHAGICLQLFCHLMDPALQLPHLGTMTVLCPTPSSFLACNMIVYRNDLKQLHKVMQAATELCPSNLQTILCCVSSIDLEQYVTT